MEQLPSPAEDAQNNNNNILFVSFAKVYFLPMTCRGRSMHRIISTYQINRQYLRDPALGIPVPFVVANILLGQCNAILERNALPAVLHKVANVLMISSVGVGLDIPVVLSPKLEGGLLVHAGKGGVAQKLGTAGVLPRSVENVAVLEFNEICCQSTIFFAYESPFDHIDESEYNRLDLDDEEEESEAPTPTPWYRTYAHLINQSVCADQPPGALCVYSNDLCTSGVCGADETCQEDKLPTLASCSDDADCDGGACGAPTVRDLAPRTVFAALLSALSSRFAPINQRVPSAVERILYALRTTATTVFVWQTRFMLAVATEDIATTIASAPQAFAFKASVSREEVPPEDPAIPIRTVSMASVA